MLAPPLETVRVVREGRLVGVDQWRYVFALWVFFSHGGAPPFLKGHGDFAIFNFLDKLYGWSVNGQAAVLGFFFISGLCIHYPQVGKQSLHIGSFYIARACRLLVPLAAILAIGWLVHFDHPGGFSRIVPIWSLYCEAIYYVLYPVIFLIIKKGRLLELTGASVVLSIALIILWADDRTMIFHEIGGGGFLAWKSAVLAFPCWLGGALMAERLATSVAIPNKVPMGSLIRWRIGALFLSTLTFPLYRLGLFLDVIHHPFVGLIFSSQFTLLMFGLYGYFWLLAELTATNLGGVPVNARLEKLGESSYSLYLVHMLILWAFAAVPAKFLPGHLLSWLLLMAVLHVAVFIFFVTVEKPSHMLAKKGSLAVKKRYKWFFTTSS